MEEKYLNLLNELVKEYSNYDYLGGHYGRMLVYGFDKENLIITICPSFNLVGDISEHSGLIKKVVSKLYEILPKDFAYKLKINGFYCDITNGNFDLKFKDGNYYIEPQFQKMHEDKQILTIRDVLEINKNTEINIKWSLLKKKSIELGFTPIKEKSGFENLYKIEAFKQCYPQLNYTFNIVDKQEPEPKRKKFFGLF